ncbi:hypothetical protein [Cricetibacter osteomyelitidis]|nr:hypothetical protein [Cricetibacter osteomyelitidis]
MLKLFSPPIKKETAESWAKILDDIAKVALLAVPVIIYGETGVVHKLTSMVLLILVIYYALMLSKIIRNKYIP